MDITAESRPQIPTRDHVIFSNEHRRCKGRWRAPHLHPAHSPERGQVLNMSPFTLNLISSLPLSLWSAHVFFSSCDILIAGRAAELKILPVQHQLGDHREWLRSWRKNIKVVCKQNLNERRRESSGGFIFSQEGGGGSRRAAEDGSSSSSQHASVKLENGVFSWSCNAFLNPSSNVF